MDVGGGDDVNGTASGAVTSSAGVGTLVIEATHGGSGAMLAQTQA